MSASTAILLELMPIPGSLKPPRVLLEILDFAGEVKGAGRAVRGRDAIEVSRTGKPRRMAGCSFTAETVQLAAAAGITNPEVAAALAVTVRGVQKLRQAAPVERIRQGVRLRLGLETVASEHHPPRPGSLPDPGWPRSPHGPHRHRPG
ncbi:MAG: hypothetical protein FJ125_09865 [Deltaproteobacteria bacterium]|nr:hypothetical protein [Deltaproteobacteria bacterium]